MDVVALAQAGIPNAVATLGTATGVAHFEKLFRACAGGRLLLRRRYGRARGGVEGADRCVADVDRGTSAVVHVPAGRRRPGLAGAQRRQGAFPRAHGRRDQRGGVSVPGLGHEVWI